MTDRGFAHLPPIDGTYGDTIRAYESSAAFKPCLWVRIDAPGGSQSAHLTVEAALRLAGQIQHLARNHYQLRDAALTRIPYGTTPPKEPS